MTFCLGMKLEDGIIGIADTRISSGTCAVDVDYPIDVVAYAKNSYQIMQVRYEKEEIADLAIEWPKLIREQVPKLPSEWTLKIMDKLPRFQKEIVGTRNAI